MGRATVEKRPIELKGHGFDETILISDLERKFCELLATGQHNKSSARLAAGYPDLSQNGRTEKTRKNANACAAYKISNNIGVQKYTEFLSAKNMTRLSLTTDDLLKTSAAIMNASIHDLIDSNGNQKKPHELDEITARAIKRMKPIYMKNDKGGAECVGYEYEFYDKLACQRNLIALQELRLVRARLEAKMKGRKLTLTRGG